MCFGLSVVSGAAGALYETSVKSEPQNIESSGGGQVSKEGSGIRRSIGLIYPYQIVVMKLSVFLQNLDLSCLGFFNSGD
jgi:hypothetical protein